MKIADLTVGSKVLFGSYSVSGEEPHRIPWIKVHSDCTLITEYIEDQCAFDAREPNSPQRTRRDYGSNRYSTSNINQFLNSSKTEWFVPQTATDTPPVDANLYGYGGAYHNKPGFLHAFKPWEMAAILHSKLSTLLHPDDMGDEWVGDTDYEKILVKVFLPSRANMNGRGTSEGCAWEYFIQEFYPDSRRAHLSPQCFAFGRCDAKPDNCDDWWFYGLRTVCTEGDSSTIRIIDDYGDLSYEPANEADLGIRPALVINPETLVTDRPDADGYYVVLEPVADGVEIQEDEFIALIKL